MPPDNNGVIHLDHDTQPEGDSEMADGQQIAEQGNLTVAHTLMANGAAAAADRRTAAADQLASDSERMWSIAMTTPTVMAAKGMQIAEESGSGRTRVEANTPPSTQVVGG